MYYSCGETEPCVSNDSDRHRLNENEKVSGNISGFPAGKDHYHHRHCRTRWQNPNQQGQNSHERIPLFLRKYDYRLCGSRARQHLAKRIYFKQLFLSKVAALLNENIKHKGKVYLRTTETCDGKHKDVLKVDESAWLQSIMLWLSSNRFL